MDDGESSKINETAYQWMLLLRHGVFRQIVQHMGAVWGREFVEPTEDYTTIACPFCGSITDINSSEVFRCAHNTGALPEGGTRRLG